MPPWPAPLCRRPGQTAHDQDHEVRPARSTSHVCKNDTSAEKSARDAPSGPLASPDPFPATATVLTRGGSTLGGVRLTEFWDRMNAQFGEVYAQSVAKDFVFDQLGGRTVERALTDGVDAKAVWRAVCETFKVPESLR